MFFLFEGYRGKAKPNLLTQETHSLACAFRILFRLFMDLKRNDSIDILKRRILKYESNELYFPFKIDFFFNID
jgi:brefeldin A-inhibited guanine nucleotide-exchange protein